MIWSSSVLSTVSSDTEPTIVITFDSGKYVFNVGENTGRSWLQSRSYWKKARALFLTSVGTRTCSGLNGLTMFMADGMVPKLQIMGPQGLTHYIASMRPYLYRNSMAVKVTDICDHDCRPISEKPQPMYKDENISLYAIPLTPEIPSDETKPMERVGDVNMESSATPCSMKRKRSPSPESTSKRPQLSNDSDAIKESFKDRMRDYSFLPSSLRGEEAQQWRQLLIGDMLPAAWPEEKVRTGAKGKGKDKGKGKTIKDPEPPAPAIPVEPPTRNIPPRSNIPNGCRDQLLPPPNGGVRTGQTMCYVIEGPLIRGKFDVEKANALGLTSGPLRARLTRGQTLTISADDGQGGTVDRVIKPEDIISPPDPPTVVIILDVPSPDHISSLVSAFNDNSFYSQLRSKNEDVQKNYIVNTVYHLCGEGVLEDARYKEFMNGFNDDAFHIVSSREHAADPVTFTTAAFNQLRLNRLDEDMFPIPKFQLEPRKHLSSIPDLPPNTMAIEAHVTVGARPRVAPKKSELAIEHDHFHPAVTSSDPLPLPEATQKAFEASVAAWKHRQESTPKESEPGDDVVILPLGTSSALPSTYRNVSSTFIQIPNWGNILLDSGEGTWGQLVRFYGDDLARTSGVWEQLRNLKCIFLSHGHADHHVGVAKILAMRQKLNPPPTEPLYLIALRGHHLYLREQADLEDLGFDRADGNGVIQILSDTLNWRNANPYGAHTGREPVDFMDVQRCRAMTGKMCEALGLQSVITIDVNHRTRAYGIYLAHKDGWSIVFSGDTMPTNNLVHVGRNANVLIHEATMGDDQEELARQKAHSTVGQAIDIGTRMNAKNLLLTHFSARYPQIPPWLMEADTSATAARGPTLALAFDHAKIRIGDLPKLQAYLPAIHQSFDDTKEDGDEDIDPAMEVN
ncbi:RNase Z family protein [Abortiporus biennis]